jgi:ferredoxin
MKDLRDKLIVMEDPVMTKYKVVVDRDKCIGAGSCVDLARLTFRLDEEGKSSLIDQDGNSDEEKLLAAQSCPNMAIKVINTETGEVVWPK